MSKVVRFTPDGMSIVRAMRITDVRTGETVYLDEGRRPIEDRLGSLTEPYFLDMALEAAHEIKALVHALRLLRGLVQEGGVPRYTVLPGAALNSIIEEVVDPLLKRHPHE